MQTERWDRIRDLFDEVSRHPVSTRVTLLAQLCPEDAGIRNEVLSLVEHDEQAQPSFLTPPPMPEAGLAWDPDGDRHGDARDPLVGSRLGKCLVGRVIARGGMGTVYEAEQEHPRRTVAIKVMHAWAWCSTVRRRFELEVQALARLMHPHIAQIHDADAITTGSSLDGTPYFVMEYVSGAQTITGYAEERHLDLRQRLELFLQVCDAIHHGHQKGIIHRDLKPANILVDSGGQVKVIDFGVAKATDADVAATTMHTDAGQLIGTLTYMSPEQCAADPLGLDVRCDVYSLGVVLYQLVCRRLPYSVPATNLTQAARVICEQPPERPSVFDRGLRGDMEAILLKALEKDRGKRYQSVANLARDIRHQLDHEPIEARPPSRIQLTLLWSRKHPVIATAFACLVVAFGIALGAGVSVWFTLYRPANVSVTPDLSTVQITSVAGRVVYELRSATTHAFTPGGTLPRMVQAKGRTAAIVGFTKEYLGDDGYPRHLCALDASWLRRGRPIWCDAIEVGDTPPNDRPGFGAQDFSPENVWLIDAFAENPGSELVAVFAHEYSLRAIRVYSLDGELLYQVWHDGLVLSCAAMPSAGLLVFAGENSQKYWQDYDHPEAHTVTRRCPQVVFALRAHPQPPSNLVLRPMPGDGPSDPVWYRCLLPPKKTDAIQELSLLAPASDYRDGNHLRLSLHFLASVDTAAQIHLDARGGIVGPVLPSDNYNRNPGLPRVENFYLGELPPLRDKAATLPG